MFSWIVDERKCRKRRVSLLRGFPKMALLVEALSAPSLELRRDLACLGRELHPDDPSFAILAALWKEKEKDFPLALEKRYEQMLTDQRKEPLIIYLMSGIVDEKPRSWNLLLEAANLDFAPACFKVAQRFDETRDTAKFMLWMTKAADLGHPSAFDSRIMDSPANTLELVALGAKAGELDCILDKYGTLRRRLDLHHRLRPPRFACLDSEASLATL